MWLNMSSSWEEKHDCFSEYRNLPHSCMHIFRSLGQKLRHLRSFPVTLNANMHTLTYQRYWCKQASVYLNRHAHASASGRIIIKSAGPGCPETVTERVISSLKTFNTETPTPHWQDYLKKAYSSPVLFKVYLESYNAFKVSSVFI